MKIVEVISDTNIGGAGRLLVERLESSRSCGDEISVLLPKGSKLIPRLEDTGVQIIEIDGCRDRSLDLGAIFSIRDILRDIEPDVLNAHGAMSARIAAYLAGVPVRIYTRHCTYPVPFLLRSFPLKWVLGRMSSTLSPHAIAVANAAADDLESMGYPRDRIRVIINGVGGIRRYSEKKRQALRAQYGLTGRFVVGICARVEKCKDHETFLRAAKILSVDDRYRFIVVGDGTQLDAMRSLAERLGIAERVIFTGFSDDVERWFNCFDLNVNCSVGTETSSLALSEGMSIGLPAVASSYGGNPYMVKHGENGFIYKMRDAEELSAMIARIANDRDLYLRMSEAAYQRFASELNSRKMTAETLSFYRELLAECEGGVSAKE